MSSSNCSSLTTSASVQEREQTLLIQQAALYSHLGLMLLALAFFHLFAQRQLKRGRSINRRNPTILALRLGRELLENTLMWAALLNIAVICSADVGVYILMCLIPVAVVCVHISAVLHFRREIVIIDDRIESYDVALCFHFNTFFASKSWIVRFVVIASVPILTILALITGAVSGRISDFLATVSEATASFLLAFFSSFIVIKPATLNMWSTKRSGQKLVGWAYVVYQRALLRRTYAEHSMADLANRDKYRCPQALAPAESTIVDHLKYLATFQSTLLFSAREVVFRESTHLAFADHRNEQEISADMLASLTRTSVGAIENKLPGGLSKHPCERKHNGPGWGTMSSLLTFPGFGGSSTMKCTASSEASQPVEEGVASPAVQDQEGTAMSSVAAAPTASPSASGAGADAEHDEESPPGDPDSQERVVVARRVRQAPFSSGGSGSLCA